MTLSSSSFSCRQDVARTSRFRWLLSRAALPKQQVAVVVADVLDAVLVVAAVVRAQRRGHAERERAHDEADDESVRVLALVQVELKGGRERARARRGGRSGRVGSSEWKRARGKGV